VLALLLVVERVVKTKLLQQLNLQKQSGKEKIKQAQSFFAASMKEKDRQTAVDAGTTRTLQQQSQNQ
jgi:hypothetical protein